MTSPAKKRVFRLVATLGTLGMLSAGTVVIALFRYPGIDVDRDYSPPKPRLPVPNAYDLYTEAARAFERDDAQENQGSPLAATANRTGNQPPTYFPCKHADYNTEGWHALAQARLAKMVVPSSVRESGIPVRLDRTDFFRLCRIMESRTGSLEAEGHPAAACDSGLDILQMGVGMSHGGGLLSTLEGDHLELNARSYMRRYLKILKPKEFQQETNRFEAILCSRASYSDVVADERWTEAYYTQTAQRRHPLVIPAVFVPHSRFGPLGILLAYFRSPKALMQEFMTDFDQESTYASLSWSEYRQLAQPRSENPDLQTLLRWLRRGRIFYNSADVYNHELLLQMALRGYYSEHHSFPGSLAALVPKYVSQVPTDPFSSQPFHYELTPTGSRLWSVGPDGVDDHAKEIPGSSWKFPVDAGANPPNCLGDIVRTLKSQ